MKLKYYLRGFGTGVIFATLILMVAFQIQQNLTLSNSQKNEEQSSNMLDAEAGTSENDSSSDATSGEVTSTNTTFDENISSDTIAADGESTNDSATDTLSTEEMPTESTAHEEITSEEITSEEITSEETAPQETTVTGPVLGEPITTPGETAVLVITAGMTSIRATEILEELGVIEDAVDYNYYLHNNGYSSRLRVGTYEIRKGASYEEITQIIVRH